MVKKNGKGKNPNLKKELVSAALKHCRNIVNFGDAFRPKRTE